MNWLKKYYGKDPGTKWVIVAIVLFCIAIIMAGAAWWIPVAIIAGYALIFYVMRKNP
ncbi:MAG TPA: hypothetical protein VGK59_10930 [Ohtaekwangia sp.]